MNRTFPSIKKFQDKEEALDLQLGTIYIITNKRVDKSLISLPQKADSLFRIKYIKRVDKAAQNNGNDEISKLLNTYNCVVRVFSFNNYGYGEYFLTNIEFCDDKTKTQEAFHDFLSEVSEHNDNQLTKAYNSSHNDTDKNHLRILRKAFRKVHRALCPKPITFPHSYNQDFSSCLNSALPDELPIINAHVVPSPSIKRIKQDDVQDLKNKLIDTINDSNDIELLLRMYSSVNATQSDANLRNNINGNGNSDNYKQFLNTQPASCPELSIHAKSSHRGDFKICICIGNETREVNFKSRSKSNKNLILGILYFTSKGIDIGRESWKYATYDVLRSKALRRIANKEEVSRLADRLAILQKIAAFFDMDDRFNGGFSMYEEGNYLSTPKSVINKAFYETIADICPEAMYYIGIRNTPYSIRLEPDNIHIDDSILNFIEHERVTSLNE